MTCSNMLTLIDSLFYAGLRARDFSTEKRTKPHPTIRTHTHTHTHTHTRARARALAHALHLHTPLHTILTRSAQTHIIELT